MFGQIAFNRSYFNRQSEGETFVWSGSAQAFSEAACQVHLIKKMVSEADAAAAGSITAGIKHYAISVAPAEADGTANQIRYRYFKEGKADAVATGVAGGLYAVGTDFLQILDEKLTLHAGDELIIDTDRMTVLVNNRNAVDALSDDSTFFNLTKGDSLTIEGTGTATVTLLWKDRWL